MPLDKKPPRFVPTLTEVVPGKPQPAPVTAELQIEVVAPSVELLETGLYRHLLEASEQYMVRRMPELVEKHMAACETELRQEMEALIKKFLAGETQT